MPVMSAGGFRSQKLPHRGIGPGVRSRLAIQVGGVDVDAEFHSKSYGFEGEKLQFGGIRTDEATHIHRFGEGLYTIGPSGKYYDAS